MRRINTLIASPPSEARHVVGWSEADIVGSLGITLQPLASDPLPSQPGLQPWEPWPPRLAASVFLALLDRLQREALGVTDGSRLVALLPVKPGDTPPGGPWEKPTEVRVEGGCETIEGQIVKGVRDEDGAWDLDGVFTVQTEDGELIRVHGWNYITEVL